MRYYRLPITGGWDYARWAGEGSIAEELDSETGDWVANDKLTFELVYSGDWDRCRLNEAEAEATA